MFTQRRVHRLAQEGTAHNSKESETTSMFLGRGGTEAECRKQTAVKRDELAMYELMGDDHNNVG